MSLKVAVGWSVVFHAALLASAPGARFLPVEEGEQPIRVTYLSPPAPAPPQNVPQSRLAPKPPAAVSLPLQKPAPLPPVPPRQESGPPPVPAPAAPPRPVTVQEAAPSSAGSAISSLPEGEISLLEHKRQVRQHLRSRLAFPSEGVEGVVRLRLILAPEGTLRDLVLLEATDPGLAEAAQGQARAAAPYPPFPSRLKKSQVLYEYIVQYRLE